MYRLTENDNTFFAENKNNHTIFSDSLPFPKILTLKSCKFDISNSIIARGLKLYRLLDGAK